MGWESPGAETEAAGCRLPAQLERFPRGLAPAASRLPEAASQPPPEPPPVLRAGLQAAERAGTGRGAKGSGTRMQVRPAAPSPGGGAAGRPSPRIPASALPGRRGSGPALLGRRTRRGLGLAGPAAPTAPPGLRCYGGGLTCTPEALRGGLRAQPGDWVELHGVWKHEPRQRGAGCEVGEGRVPPKGRGTRVGDLGRLLDAPYPQVGGEELRPVSSYASWRGQWTHAPFHGPIPAHRSTFFCLVHFGVGVAAAMVAAAGPEGADLLLDWGHNEP